MRFTTSLILALLVSVSSGRADDSAVLRDTLISNLVFMKSVYQAEYAPAEWKKSYANWSLDTEIDRAIHAAQSSSNLTVLSTREILKNFIYSMKDYHVSISFQSTEQATLPLSIRGTKNKFFIVYIDRTKLSDSAFPFQVGDEVVTFGGKPTADAVQAVAAEIPANIPGTDQAIASINLTRRRAARGYLVPHGPITLGIKPDGSDQVHSIELIWDYVSEKIKSPLEVASETDLTSGLIFPSFENKSSSSRLLHPVMSGDRLDLGETLSDDSNLLGARKSFIPTLGKTIWESDKEDPFYAYIYQNEDRKLVGYVRIPAYEAENYPKAIASFAKIIKRFESSTDALVIDQVNNPGGSVFYLYALASMLSPQALSTPLHEMAITPADVMDAQTNLSQLDGVKDDESAKKVLGDTLDGFPVSYEVAQFARNYFRFLVGEFEAGHHVSSPYYISGADKINPAETHYSKPILLLTNELDFSGGDFFPAIMQDNKRVTILGTRTAGAGGYVNDVTYPNALGIASFRVTESIAKRVSDNPIENLGVKPDVEYAITENDFAHGYADYTKAIRAAVATLLK